MGHDGTFLGETFDVRSLLAQVTLGDEQREVSVHVSGVLELAIEHLFHALPNGETVWLDDHTPLYITVLGEVGLDDNLVVPLGIILFSGS